MSDNSSTVPSLAGKLTMPSLLASSKLFVGFSPKGFLESESAKSPTSILDTRPFSVIGHPFFAERSYKKPYCCNENSTAIGLRIIDALTNDERPFNTCTRMVLFGSQHKLQIPRIQSVESPHSPIEFGIKNKDSLLALHSPAGYVAEAPPPSSPPGVFSGEMELSEDYTCVISHGPNPKKTHIFNNCIVESCGESAKKSNSFLADKSSDYPPDNFLSFCHACKKNLSHGKDVFMFRDKIALCSPECLEREMTIYDDEGAKCFQA